MNKWSAISWRSLRFRLIGWYILLLVLTLAIFSIYIFVEFRNLEQNQQDTALQGITSNLQGLADAGGADGGRPGGGRPGNDQSNANSQNTALRFRTPPGSQPFQDLNRGNFQARILTLDGKVSDSLGTFVAAMPLSLPKEMGFVTLSTEDNAQWRIYNQPLMRGGGNQVGWLQVGQPLVVLNTETGKLFTPILLGTFIALILAVLGGLFLANQALQPIDRVTRTAQAIGTQDLSRRIDYHGPADEIGRLAKTLDQMLDRLEKGFEQERRFTSDASHELRTPLTALKGRIEVTLSRLRSPQEYQETLEDLSHEVNRLIRLSSSLLYLARLDQDNQEQESEILNLSDMLESILDTMQPIAELKEISLEGKIPDQLNIQGNLDQLTRLFLNLVDNAIKYTPKGGKVRLYLKKAEKNARVIVADNGPGIAPEHLPHLFKRFYRAESDRASRSGGAGLGLAIAYEIARQHGGTLEIESEVGQGTTFIVELPLQEAAKQK